MRLKYGKIIIIVGLMFIFILSSINPMVTGRYKMGFENESLHEGFDTFFFDLKFDIEDDSYTNAKFEYYKEQLLKCSGNPEKKHLDLAEVKIIIEPPSNSLTSFGPMNSSWPMKSHDVRHTGLSPYSTEFVDGSEKWRFDSSWVEAGIAIDDKGIVYFGNHGWNIFALYSDSLLKWSYSTESPITSTPAIAVDGTVYIGSWDYYLYAMNPDGSLKWRFPSNASIASSPVIADDGTIYFGTMWTGGRGGKIYAINPDGTEKWKYQTGYHIESDPAIGDDGTIYIGSGDDYLYAMNPDGSLKWRFQTGDEIHNDPSIAEDGTIYIGSFDDYLYAINPDGTEKWRYDTGFGASGGIAIGLDGTIYVGTDDIYAINPDGTTKWIFNLYGYYISESSPAISADGTIYIGITTGVPGYGDGGVIIAINPDGTEKWRKRMDNSGWMDSSPAIAEDGTIFIGSICEGSEGYLHAFGNYHDLKINELKGGFGKVSAVITNNLDHAIEDIEVVFTVQGGILDLINAESHITIDSLDSGESKTIRSKGRILGLGPVDINVKAICDEVGEVSLYEPGLVLLFLVLKTNF